MTKAHPTTFSGMFSCDFTAMTGILHSVGWNNVREVLSFDRSIFTLSGQVHDVLDYELMQD